MADCAYNGCNSEFGHFNKAKRGRKKEKWHVRLIWKFLSNVAKVTQLPPKTTQYNCKLRQYSRFRTNYLLAT